MKIGGLQKFSTVDYPGHTCAAIFTIGCDLRCGYCHNPELVLPEQYLDSIPESVILEFLETRRGLIDGVTISGGDPVKQPDLPDFCQKVKDMGFLVKLDSAGVRPDVIRELISRNIVDFIAMDIKGPLHKYSEIAARPVDTDAIQESIALIKTIDHEFRTTIVRELLTVEDFHDIGKLVRGAKRFALQRFNPGTTLSPTFANSSTFTDEEMANSQAIMSQYVAECVVH